MRLLALRLNKHNLIFSGSPLPELALDKAVGRKSTLRSTAGRLSLRSSPIPQTPADYTYTHIHTYWLQTITHTDTSPEPPIQRLRRIKESKKKVSKKILSSTTVSTLIINQYIRMISEGSCDTEDWSNAENSALLYRNTLYFKIYKNRKPILEIAIAKEFTIILLFFCFSSVFWSNKYSLDEHKWLH